MRPPSEVLAQIIHNGDLAIFSGVNPTDWLLTYGKMPESEDTLTTEPLIDDCVVTADYGSIIDGRNMRDGAYDKHPKVQIRVRSKNYADGYAKAEEILVYLTEGLVPSLPLTLAVSGDTFEVRNISLLSSVMYMGQDEKHQRQHFSLNVALTLSEV
jgi:hypothetical protein